MSNFNEQTKEEKICRIKDEYFRVIEEVMHKNNAEICKVIPADKLKDVLAFVPKLKPAHCICDEGCIDTDKVDGVVVPDELECLIDIARDRCEKNIEQEI